MTTYTIVITVFFSLLGLIAVLVAASAIHHRLMPLEKRMDYVRKTLIANESKTGTTHILSSIGVTDDQTKKIAAGEGFNWVSYSGQNDRQLNFQRSVETTTLASTPRPELLALLANATAGIDGVARVDVTTLDEQLSKTTLQQVATSQGWVVMGLDDRHLLMKRPDSATAPQTGPAFLTGPSLSELRKHPHAHSIATRLHSESGVDPLAESALDQARGEHFRLRRKSLRFVCLAVVSGLTLLVLVLATGKQVISDGPIVAVSLLLVLGLGWGWLGAWKTEKARKASVLPYTAVYTQLVAELLRPQRD